MLKNDGYILLESVISLMILLGIVYGYVAFSLHLQKQSQRQLEQVEHYEVLYHETQRFRYHQETVAPEVTVTVKPEQVAATWTKGEQAIEVAKK